jgi:hypothetical protein
VGDVAAYISPYKDSKFDELRQAIQKVGLDVGKIVYGFGKDSSTAPKYEKVIVVGHSLGSVLAYDTLNALINLDNVSSDGQKRDVVGRTRAVVTFGSPLDKTAFIFRMQAKSDEDWIREQMTDSVQPLIVSYAEFRPETLTWVNIWSRMDIISGSLDYYDDPVMPPDLPQHVQNMVDPQANIPLKAHVQYWNNELFAQDAQPVHFEPSKYWAIVFPPSRVEGFLAHLTQEKGRDSFVSSRLCAPRNRLLRHAATLGE